MDAAHANNIRRRRSKTGYAFLLNVGIFSCCSKTQSTTAMSNTEAEFLAAVTATKHAKRFCAVLLKIRYPQDGPTPLCEGNMSAINVINNCVLTEQSCHIEIQHFAI